MAYLMDAHPSWADVDWRPYWATAAVLALALALNAWTRNGLWFWYTSIGVGGLLTFVGLARTGRFRFPTRSVWMLGIGGAMHYLGGSLGGLHQIGGSNGLYYVFPWWDNLVHLLGSGAVGVAAATVLVRWLPDRPVAAWWFATSVAVNVGAMVELYEFAQFLAFGTIDQGFYTNTLLDLWNNLLGGALGAFIIIRLERPASEGEAFAVQSVD